MDVKSQLEHQIQIQETKQRGWIFDKNNSIKIRFSKTGELNGSSYVKNPLRSNAILNLEKMIIIVSFGQNSHPSRVLTFIQCFNELNIHGFAFSNGFKCCHDHKFANLNILSINKFELTFYPDGNTRKHNLLPIEVSKNHSDKVSDLLV